MTMYKACTRPVTLQSPVAIRPWSSQSHCHFPPSLLDPAAHSPISLLLRIHPSPALERRRNGAQQLKPKRTSKAAAIRFVAVSELHLLLAVCLATAVAAAASIAAAATAAAATAAAAAAATAAAAAAAVDGLQCDDRHVLLVAVEVGESAAAPPARGAGELCVAPAARADCATE